MCVSECVCSFFPAVATAMASAAALASLEARSSAAAPSSPVGSRRLAAAVPNNVIGPDSSRRAAGAASSPIFCSTSLSTNLCQSSCCSTERRSRPIATEA